MPRPIPSPRPFIVEAVVCLAFVVVAAIDLKMLGRDSCVATAAFGLGLLACLWLMGSAADFVHDTFMAYLERGQDPPRWAWVAERQRAYTAKQEFIGDHADWVERIKAGGQAGWPERSPSLCPATPTPASPSPSPTCPGPRATLPPRTRL